MRKHRLALVTALLLVSATACGSAAGRAAAPHVTRTVTPVSSADSFFAVAETAGGSVEQISAVTGKPIRQIAPGQRDGLSVSGLARQSAQTLLLTYATGPQCSSNVAGCGPKVNTCGGEVDSLNTATGAIKTLWRVGRNEMLRGAQPSPDGTMIAALASPCVPSYFNAHVVVRRLRDGATWSIGDWVARCHLLGDPLWSADSAHLLLTYAPPTGSTPYTGADGTCSDFGDSSLVEVGAGHPQPLITGTVSKVAAGCTYQSTAISGTNAYVIEACGPDPTRLHGPATLVRLDPALKVTGRWPIGECTDGNALGADPAKGVLIAAYLFCNPPMPGQKLADPITVLDRLKGASLQRMTAISGGQTAYSYLTW